MRQKTASVPKQNEIDDSVKLKPLMGIRPGVYLSVLYSIILLVIFFFLLVFPGLVRGGAVLTVKTEPMGAAIRVNGVYMGTYNAVSSTSADGIFLLKGIYTVEAVLPGFEKAGTVCEIPRRIFGSLFFPLRKKIELTLTTPDPVNAFATEAADFAAWSFGPEPTASWQIPLSLSQGAYRAGPAANAAMYEILAASSRFIVTRAALRDLVRAKFLLDSRGLSPSPAGLIDSVADILLFLSENPGSGRLLADLLPPEPSDLIKKSAWYDIYYADLVRRNANLDDSALPSQINIAGLSFVNVKNFLISESLVPRSLFENFVEQNPQWKEAQTDYYPGQISVYPGIFDTETVTGVTWYGAQAFCAWLAKQLPSSMADLEIRLPMETEWEEYVKITGIESSGWEWCADPFAPFHFIFPAASRAIEAVGSPERSIRRITLTESRASLPPELSSPFLSFRPVIVKRDN